MGTALKGGAIYFLLVFAAGFLLGAARTLIVAPTLGDMLAVLVELPIILLLSWFICRALIKGFAVPAAVPARILMGATALALLLAAELLLSAFLFGRTIAEHLALYQTAEGLTGLAGQFVFGLFPVIQLFTESE